MKWKGPIMRLFETPAPGRPYGGVIVRTCQAPAPVPDFDEVGGSMTRAVWSWLRSSERWCGRPAGHHGAHAVYRSGRTVPVQVWED